ncbi:hypothetical protein [Labedella endophytica]|uniref:Uncharacterized protein n=1 Tax=Labedella endophytica TaxID=1523160 RepID=A0A433JUV1_9MICO|nr:hypothetical protein [Labedella endophytica]RUR01947.1 hypothetical protein ELQ94_10945 [Labedella endophytica]
MTNDTITRALAGLDPAPGFVLDDTARRRADARREQIIASDPATPTAPGATPRPRSSRRRSWIAATAAAAAVSIGGALVVGALAPSDAAYASWTATPASLDVAERDLAATACLDASGQADADTVLAERRGEWIAVAAVADGSTHIACLVHLPTGTTDPGSPMWAMSGGEGAVPVGDEITGGSLAEFAGRSFPGIEASPTVSFTIGDVGPDVEGVDITTPDGDLVHATVQDGRYLAWWPGSVFVPGDGDDMTTVLDVDYRVTLTDGTVLDDARPIVPE